MAGAPPTLRLLRRRGAMCALGAALLAFPAGLAIGISGTLSYGRAAAAPQAVAAPIKPDREAVLVAEVKKRQRQYLSYYYLALALEQELRRMRPDGVQRALRVVREESEKRRAESGLFADGAPFQGGAP